MEKFNNKYRIASARTPWWDYGNAGAYFITICTKNREHFFGEINEGKMRLSPLGVIADVLWHEIPHHSQNVEIDAFVVMPNHIHGILILIGNDTGIDTDVKSGFESKSTPNETKRPNFHPRFRNPGKNTVSSIIGGYKSAVTKHANRLGLENGWQTRFYDQIIRNEQDYQSITNYITTNPLRWNNDKFYP